MLGTTRLAKGVDHEVHGCMRDTRRLRKSYATRLDTLIPVKEYQSLDAFAENASYEQHLDRTAVLQDLPLARVCATRAAARYLANFLRTEVEKNTGACYCKKVVV